jgi:hypothetical protein
MVKGMRVWGWAYRSGMRRGGVTGGRGRTCAGEVEGVWRREMEI